MSNIFSKIIRKEAKAEIVFESVTTLCFKDCNPMAKYHYLFIPKNLYLNFIDFTTNADEKEIYTFYKELNHTIKNILNLKQFKLQTNNGIEADQEIMHFHIHILSNENVL